MKNQNTKFGRKLVVIHPPTVSVPNAVLRILNDDQ